MINKKIRDGFADEKLISLPHNVIRQINRENLVDGVYITHIGYFPKAKYHFRSRKKGCRDNILLYCINGKGYIKIGHVEYTLCENQYIIVKATKEPISYWADESNPWTIYWLHYTCLNIDKINHRLNGLLKSKPQNISFNEQGISLWSKMYDILSIGLNDKNLILANMHLEYFITTFLFSKRETTRDNHNQALVENTIEYIKQNINRPISLCELANKQNLSTQQLSRIFKKQVGITPMNFYIRLKMNKAKDLLLTTDSLVKEIANRLGYDDVYYFSRLFKKYNLMSPEQYKKEVRSVYSKR